MELVLEISVGQKLDGSKEPAAAALFWIFNVRLIVQTAAIKADLGTFFFNIDFMKNRDRPKDAPCDSESIEYLNVRDRTSSYGANVKKLIFWSENAIFSKCP